MITDTRPYVSGGKLILPMGRESDDVIAVPLDVVRTALTSPRGTWKEGEWRQSGATRPVFVKIVRDLYTLGSSAPLALREKIAYTNLATVGSSPHIALCHAILAWQTDFADEQNSPVTIFVLERLGLTARELAQDPSHRPALAGLVLRDGLAAVLELAGASVSSRDPHPDNLLLADPFATSNADLHQQTLKLVDLGHAYLPDNTQISTDGTLLGLPDVQPPHVLRGATPHGVLDDAFGIAMSAYAVATGGKIAYVRRIGDKTEPLRLNEATDYHLWEIDDSFAQELASCDPEIARLIEDIIRSRQWAQSMERPEARALVQLWQSRAESGDARPETNPYVGTPGDHAAPAWPPAEFTAEVKVAEQPNISAPKADTALDPTVDDEVAAARRWLKAENVGSIAGRRDFQPHAMRLFDRPISPVATATLWAACTLVVVVLLTLIGWPWFFSGYGILPATFETFNDWQKLIAWSAAGIASVVAAATIALMARRFPRASGAVGLTVAIIVIAGSAGVAAIASTTFIASASATPIDCTDPIEPPTGSAISCVTGALASWWQADDPYVQTEKLSDDGETVAFDGTSLLGVNTGARIYYHFTSDLYSCVEGWLFVYQTTDPADWGHKWGNGDDQLMTTVLRSGSGIARFAPGRNTWEAYEAFEPDGKVYTGVREYHLTGMGDGQTLGSTRAMVGIRATDCLVASRAEIDAAGLDLLSAIQLGVSSVLDPPFVRVIDDEAGVGPSNLSIPVVDGVRPLYPFWWEADPDQLVLGTGLVLTTASGTANATVWVAPLGDSPATEGWETLDTEEEGDRFESKSVDLNGETWLLRVFVYDAANLGQEGDPLIAGLLDSIDLSERSNP